MPLPRKSMRILHRTGTTSFRKGAKAGLATGLAKLEKLFRARGPIPAGCLRAGLQVAVIKKRLSGDHPYDTAQWLFELPIWQFGNGGARRGTRH